MSRKSAVRLLVILLVAAVAIGVISFPLLEEILGCENFIVCNPEPAR